MSPLAGIGPTIRHPELNFAWFAVTSYGYGRSPDMTEPRRKPRRRDPPPGYPGDIIAQ